MTTTILDLPCELRDLIYLECGFHFQSARPSYSVIRDSHYLNGHQVFHPSCQVKYPSLSLLAVNKQIRDEVLSLFPLLSHLGQINFDMQILAKGDDFRPSWTFMTLGLPPACRVNNLVLDVIVFRDYFDGVGPFLSERPVDMMSGLARFIVPFLHYGPSFLDAQTEHQISFMGPFLYLNSSYFDTRQDYSVQGSHSVDLLLVKLRPGANELGSTADVARFEEFVCHMRRVMRLDAVAKLVQKIRIEAEFVTPGLGGAERIGEWDLTADDWDDGRSLRDGWVYDRFKDQ